MSELLPSRIDLPSASPRNTYPSFGFHSTVTPATTLARAILVIEDSDCNVFLECDSAIEDSGITIDDAVTWEGTIDKFTAPSAVGIYTYKIDTIDSASNRRTMVTGNLIIE